MKKLMGFIVLLTIAFSLNAQEQSNVEREVETLVNQIQSVAKSQISEVEKNAQISGIISDFLENNPVAVYKMRMIDAGQKLDAEKKETPIPEDKLKQFIELQKQSYALLGDLVAGNIPRGGTEMASSSEEAVTNYCGWSITTGNTNADLPGYTILTPDGINAYNNDIMILNENLSAANQLPMIPMTYAWTYKPWKSVTINTKGF